MRIAIVGCGAVGSYYGAKLLRAGQEVHFILRSDFEHVRRHGVRVLGSEGDFHVQPKCVRSPAEVGVCDLVLVALKTTANGEFARLLPPLVGAQTAVITLQNGLGNEEALARVVPAAQVLGGLCFVCLNRVSPGVIQHIAFGKVVLGEYRRWPEPRTHDLCAMFKHAGVPCRVADDLECAHWEKLVWNIPFNGLGVAAVAGWDVVSGNAPVPAKSLRERCASPRCLATDALLGDPRWERLVRELMDEVIATANVLGHGISAAWVEKNIANTRTMGAYRASTLIDFEQGRALELGALFEEPLRLAQQHGVPTPRLARLVQVLRSLDAGRAGSRGSTLARAPAESLSSRRRLNPHSSSTILPHATMSVRVRFAPSPTGYLHIGGARTALFNWLYARHTGGTFILRIEDTDAARNSLEAVNVILDGLRWLGLDWDEGPVSGDATGASKGDRGPYFQSQRRENYQRRAEALLARGLAYEKDGAIRFRMQREAMLIPDLIVGDVRRELTDREQADPDFVIVRSDGQPVFHFTNVVDDLEMGITHVIRGEDHLSNTAKHIALFNAFGVTPPKYAHIPLILNRDGSKMSKRDTGASMTTYIEEGYVPEAVVNYLCLLGWSPKGNREVLPVPEVIEAFDLPQILRHNARFDLEKLQWVNGEYLRSMPAERYYELAVRALAKSGLDTNSHPLAYVKAALDTTCGKTRLLAELAAYAGFYFASRFECDPAAVAAHFTAENKPRVARLRESFAALPVFDAPSIEASLKSVATELGVKAGVLVHPVRLACTGKTAGPSLYHLLEVLGRDRVFERMDRALERM